MERKASNIAQGRAGKSPGGLPVWVSAWLILGMSAVLGLWTVPRSMAAGSVAKIVARQGRVDYDRAARTNWMPAVAGQDLEMYDRLRTLARSQAAVQLADLSVLRVNADSLLDILPPRAADARSRIDVRLGAFYFLHRNQPREIDVRTPTASAVIRGTEFHILVEPSGRTVITMIDGEVGLTNALDGVLLRGGEQGIVDPGQPPRKTAVLDTVNIIQWCLYYPAVLDPDELGLAVAEQNTLAASLAAYRSGELLLAQSAYAEARALQPVAVPSDAERAYRASLLLAVGDVPGAEAELAALPPLHPQAVALQWLIAAVQMKPRTALLPPTNSSQRIGHSYFLQSRYEIEKALDEARAATRQSPDFGFAWERAAELEYMSQHLVRARQSLDRALQLAPRNPQAHALRGFVLLGQDRVREAAVAFQQALDLDSALGNAWLGRGLCRMREGRSHEGRADIQTAAAMEPNRWLLRSYLGKAYGEEAADKADEPLDFIAKARRELSLGAEKDPNDPTPWLYSALLNHQLNRTADAIRDLEKSVELNDNRRVYRSRLALDQDLATRGASLAAIYESAGMTDVGLRESSRAVTYDYGNFSAHRNLASSFNALRDPSRFNNRFDNDWLHEVFMANLLAPPGGLLLSQNMSQDQYYRPFANDRFGLSTSTEYFSDGEFRQLATQFGAFRNTSYALDLRYITKPGNRPNNDLNGLELYAQIKQKLTDQDSLLLVAEYWDYRAGDNFQYYDPADARHDYRLKETQTPNLWAGYHREWAPGIHTLFLAGRLANETRVSDQGVNQLVLRTNGTSGRVEQVQTLGLNGSGNDVGGADVEYRNQFEIYTAELSQIFQRERHTDVLGGLYQGGRMDTHNRMSIEQLSTVPGLAGLTNLFPNPPEDSHYRENFERYSAYGYHTWEVVENLFVTAGVSYDHLSFPVNFRQPPLTPGEDSREQVSPKGAVVWSPAPALTLRGAYSQALGGVSYDESARLEPTQLAGFRQSFRSQISESIASSVTAPSYESYGVAADFKFKTKTYLSLQGDVLNTDVRRTIGAFGYESLTDPAPVVSVFSTRERLDYQQWSARAVLNQTVGREWFFEAQYRFTFSELEQTYPDVPVSVSSDAHSTRSAGLHEVRLSALYKHSSGLFGRAETWWLSQRNFDYSPALKGDDVVQVNLYAGYELPWKRGDLTLGLLNVGGQDYRLNPLSPYAELPRERLFYARLRLNF